MLHNTGPYGPGEQPVNMGTSLNLSQMNGMNLVNNLSKNVQEQSQTGSGHYNLPNYSPYGPQALNMTSQFTQFANYHNSNYPANFSLHNSTPTDFSPWHNSMLSMNSSSQNDRYGNVLNYSQSYDRKVPEAPINMETGRKGSRLSAPQIFSKEYLGHEAGYRDNSHYNARSRELERNIVAKTEGKLSMDSSRRRSLENTVKLIENLLLNSTKHKEYQKQTNSQENVNTTEEEVTEKQTPKVIETDDLDECNVKEKEPSSKLYKRLTKEQEETPEESTKSADDIDKTSDHEDAQDDDKSSETSEEMSIKKENDDLLPDIEIKVEEGSWTDCDFPNPFHRDCHSVLRDDVEGSMIIDGAKSVSEAFEACKNGSVTDNLFYECPHCNILMQHPKRFLIHTKWHFLGTNKKTELAKKREMRKEAKIIEKMRIEEENKPKKFQCKDCDKIFNTKSTLKNHRHRNHSARGLERKIRPRTTVSAFQCPDCPKRFKHKHSLDKHRDTHLEKTHPCAECPKKFGSQVLLKMHMKSHERALRGPTFRCTYCGKGYYEAYTLQVHERTHRNERPFSCDICNATFGTNSSLKRHIRVSHSTSKPYECATCHRCFVSESIRNRHEMRSHGNPDNFKFTCKNCPARYMKLKDLQRHSCKAHPKAKSPDNSRSDDE